MRDGILDGMRVETQFLGECQQQLVVGFPQVDPHQRGVVREMVGDVGEGDSSRRRAARRATTACGPPSICADVTGRSVPDPDAELTTPCR